MAARALSRAPSEFASSVGGTGAPGLQQPWAGILEHLRRWEKRFPPQSFGAGVNKLWLENSTDHLRPDYPLKSEQQIDQRNPQPITTVVQVFSGVIRKTHYKQS